MEQAEERLAKGTNLVDLVRLLRSLRKQRSLPALSAAGERLLRERILPSKWYPHRTFLELIRFTFEHVLEGSEEAAYEMGASGGRAQLAGAHKALLIANDARSSVLAMRHVWRTSFNFGTLAAQADPGGVVFSLSGYEDVPAAHGFMIAGWAASGAQLAGVPAARAAVLKRPWQGEAQLVYRIELPAAVRRPSVRSRPSRSQR